MATQTELNDINEGITNSEALLDISNQILNSYSERKKLTKSISAEERLYYNTVSQQQRLSQQIVANSDKHLGFLIKSKDLSRDIKATGINMAKAEAAYTAGKEKKLDLETKIYASKKAAIKTLIEIRKQEKVDRENPDATNEQKKFALSLAENKLLNLSKEEISFFSIVVDPNPE